MIDAVNGIIQHLSELMTALGLQMLRVLAYPLDPGQRIFLLYLLTSVLFAALVYVRKKKVGRSEGEDRQSFFSFLFPQQVWSHPSAWLDVRYFFFHQLVRLVIYGVLMAGVTAMVFQSGTALTESLLGEEGLF